MSPNPSKLARKTPYIGTHNNTFHCDDVTACFMLKQLDRFKDHDIVRTRDADLLAGAEIVVDVGGELDVDSLRLDHHQRSFHKTILDYHPKLNTTRPEAVRLSSAGLVYAVFGKELIAKLLKMDKSYENLDDNQKRKVDAIFAKAYLDFFEEIDAIDNGVEVASGDNVSYNYHINSGLSSRVARINPTNKDASDGERLELFHRAMDVVGAEMVEGIHYLGTFWWENQEKIREAVLKRKEVDPSGQIVLIEGDMVGFNSLCPDLEREFGIEGQLKFVIYPEDQGKRWRVLTVRADPRRFESRIPLPEEWRGKRDEELQKVSKVSDATFVHMNGFTGGAMTKAGVLSMIHKTLGIV